MIDHATAGQVLARHGLVDHADIVGLDPGPLAPGPHHPEIRPTDLLERRCHTSTGSNIHPDLALGAMIRGHVRRVVVDSAGVVIDLGRSRRLFTGKAREAAQLLAVSCTARGCDIPAEFCDIDHLDEWDVDGGATDQHNGGPFCGHHNRYKHDHRLRAKRTADGRIRLLGPDGTLIGPVGEREPEWADDRPPVSAVS